MLYRRRLTVLVVFALTTAAAVAGVYLTRPVFTASTSLLVRLGREFLYRPEVGGLEASRVFSLEEMVNSQVEILQSRDLARQAIEELGIERLYPDLAEDESDSKVALAKAVAAFQQSLGVASVAESGIIKISFGHREATTAADALNTLVEKFKEKHLELFSDTNLKFLQEESERYRKDLAKAEMSLQTFKQEQGIFEPAGQKQAIVKEQAELQTELRGVRFRIKEIEEQLKALRSGQGDDTEGDLSGIVANDAFSRQRVALLTARSDADSALQEVDGRIAELTQNLAQFEDRKSDSSGEVPPQPGVEQFRSLEEARVRLLDRQLRYLELRSNYNEKSREASAVEREMRLVEAFLKKRGSYVSKVLESGIRDQLSGLQARRKALADQVSRINDQLKSLVDTERSIQTQALERELAALEFKKDTLVAEIARLEREVASSSEKEKMLRELERNVAVGEQHYQTYLEKYEQARTAEKLDEQKVLNIRVIERATPPVAPAGLSRKMRIVLGIGAGLLAGIASAFLIELVKR